MPANNTIPAAPQTPEQPQPKTSRFAAVRTWWATTWSEGGVLHQRWEDLRRAPQGGWHGMAHWIKAVIGVAGICLVILLLDGATDVLADAMHHLLTAAHDVQVGTDTTTGVWGVIDNPVRTYIATHSASLTISASTIYTLWQATGLFGLIGGWFSMTGARLTWTLWGAATIAMTWTTAPTDSRTIATGITVLAWTAASTLALHGLTLRASSFVHVRNDAPTIDVRPQVHIPAQPTPPADGTPDNVRPLQR
ncbi:hypothetical protein [Streptomyces sp. NPDC057429]|uniref:hypothetical protein n=1 Tax=Streptomyces sp. NPDC057429 TaxID=3346130 RepID=UPI0036C9B79D